MKQNNNISVIPFYTDIRLQNHRLSYSYGDIYPLLVLGGKMLPFQINRNKITNGIEKVELYTCEGVLYADVTTAMIETGLQIKREVTPDLDVIVYPGQLPLSSDVPNGMYYLVISDGVNKFYSEIFTFQNHADTFIKIEWYDLEDFVMDDGVIVYNNPKFVNRLYFNAELGKPEYPFDEEVENRDGYTFATKQISEKKYKTIVLAPEYLCDVMRLIRMADFIKVTDHYGREYHCDNFLITPKWLSQGNLASVEIEFETNTVAKKLSQGYIRAKYGDFEETDYTNDYLINKE